MFSEGLSSAVHPAGLYCDRDVPFSAGYQYCCWPPVTIEHLKYGNCGPGNEFNLIKIKFKDHMWLVTHVSLNAGREITHFYLDHPPPFQQALLSVYVVAVFFLRLWSYQATLASSRIGEAVTVLQRDRQIPVLIKAGQ